MKFAFQGERGAFSHDAARRFFAHELELLPCRTFEEVFEAASEGRVDAAVIPIENTLAGSVHRNYELLAEHELTILAETSVRINHHLIGRPGSSLSATRRVYSHPVALAQCLGFFRQHPELEAVAALDTAGSVRMVMEGERDDEAAIAGRSAAEVYGGSILVESIEDHPENFTRFLLLVPSGRAADFGGGFVGTPKTAVLFRLPNVPGSLFRALAVFALRDISLSKIESRPIPGRPWEYSFYADFLGSASDPGVERALAHLAEFAESSRVLGSYVSIA